MWLLYIKKINYLPPIYALYSEGEGIKQLHLSRGRGKKFTVVFGP